MSTMRRNQQRGEKRGDGGSTILVEEQSDESTTQAILRGITALKGVAETELDPIYSSIETDSMEQLLDHSRMHDSTVSVTFDFEGCTVCVRSKEDIQITSTSSYIG